MAEELSLIEQFFTTTLGNDATLTALLGTQPAANGGGPGVFMGYAPQDAVFPIVICKWLGPIGGGSAYGGGGDLYVNGAVRVWTRCRYQIMAVDQRMDYEGLAPIASRIDVLLSITGDVAVTGGTIKQCIREQPDKRPDFAGAGQEFRQLGAFWDVIAQST